MNVLDVGLVLLDESVQRESVEPHGVIDVPAVLVRVLTVEVLVVQGLLQRFSPFADSFACFQNNFDERLILQCQRKPKYLTA